MKNFREHILRRYRMECHYRKDLINQLLTIVTFFLFNFPIISQDLTKEINYQSIKQKIQAGYLDQAFQDTEEFLRENPGDATLALYQAEIWIEKGERYYKRRKFRSSLQEFEKVYKVWSNNAFVRQRYFELKNKQPLVDYDDSTGLSALVPIGLQGTENKQDSPDNTYSSSEEENDWKNLDAKDRILYRHIIHLENLLFVSLFVLGIINIRLLYIIAKKK